MENLLDYGFKNSYFNGEGVVVFFFFKIFDLKKKKTFRSDHFQNDVGNDPRDRKFNIKRQQEMYDGDGKFVRKWMQEQLF